MEKNDRIDLNAVIQITKKKKWLIFSCLLGVIIPTVFYNELSPLIYRTDTTIIYETAKGPADLISSFSYPSDMNFISGQIEEIKSRSLFEELVTKLPDSIIQTFPLPKKFKPNMTREKYLAALIRENISATQVLNSKIIKIEVEAFSPMAAYQITNSITEILKKRNLSVRREESANFREMIEEQLIKFKKQLDDAEISLKKFKEINKITIINKEVEEIFRRITEAEIIYNQATTNFEAYNKRYELIQDKMKEQRQDLVPLITHTTSPWAQQLKKELVDLEVQYTILKIQDYKEDHPKMQKLKKQIEQTKQNLKDESLKIAAGEEIIDPIAQIQKLMEESIDLEIEIETYKAQERALKNVIETYEKDLGRIPAKELELAHLSRDKEVNEKIYTMLLQKKEEVKIAEAEKVGIIRIIDNAEIPIKPIKPKKFLNLFLGILFGSISGFGLVFLLENFSNRIKTVEEAERLSNLPVVGTIPRIGKNKKKAAKKSKRKNGKKIVVARNFEIINEKYLSSYEAEAFRSLRTNLKFSNSTVRPKTLLFTSAKAAEGKSTIAANLAISIAQLGIKTLLVDADLRKPVLHKLFSLKRTPGLVDIVNYQKSNHPDFYQVHNSSALSNHKDLQINAVSEQLNDLLNLQNANDLNNDEIRKFIKDTVQLTLFENLYVLTCGAFSTYPADILASKATEEMIFILREMFDAILIDTPPINLVTDAGVLGKIVDGTVLVVRMDEVTVGEFKRAKELLLKSESSLIGFIANIIKDNNNAIDYYKYCKK